MGMINVTCLRSTCNADFKCAEALDKEGLDTEGMLCPHCGLQWHRVDRRSVKILTTAPVTISLQNFDAFMRQTTGKTESFEEWTLRLLELATLPQIHAVAGALTVIMGGAEPSLSFPLALRLAEVRFVHRGPSRKLEVTLEGQKWCEKYNAWMREREAEELERKGSYKPSGLADKPLMIGVPWTKDELDKFTRSTHPYDRRAFANFAKENGKSPHDTIHMKAEERTAFLMEKLNITEGP